MIIQDLAQLRSRYGQPKERAVKKQLSSLDFHCKRFMSLSPFVVVSTCDETGRLDASPRGGEPGFVQVTEHGELLIPDASGNNRLDSLQNIVKTGRIGLLFMIPGVDETLRVNGTAVVSIDEDDIQACLDHQNRLPLAVIRVNVEEAYLHCAKAYMRSRLWSQDAKIPRGQLPTMNQMLHDQIGDPAEPESQESMLERYRKEI